MKTIYLILITVLCSLSGWAQDKEEKIKTLKTAYITEQLSLTKAEAEKFWPVYNAFDKKNDDLRHIMREQRRTADLEKMSETQAQKLLSEMLKNNEQRHHLFTQYIKDLQNILPAKKIILLKKAEDDFRRKMFEEYKKRNHNK
ncbi:sensor of ECF-type sigma factor [Formosa sp. S-31]|uniref:sensor of ECF-type sigma factor n=1 Tax=Formosa sp. S-31 TaxID=2790949 RepID=UPI003EB71C02